jgi:nucleoside-diphosphate-sugar epimerase
MEGMLDFLTDVFRVDPALIDGPVLVTGAGGCIGAWTVAILARSGVPLVAFDLRDDRRRPGLLLDDEAVRALTWETGDIADGARLRDICANRGVRSIIHLAGLQVPFCKADPAAGARVNVEGTINVLEAARHLGLRRLAYASSTATLGMPPGGPILSTLYGVYKLANEYSARMYWLDWQVPSVGIRPNVVYGVARDQGMTSSFSVAVARAVLNEPFEIPYTGPISWLYAGEAASAFIAAVCRDGKDAPVFNLSGTSETIERGLQLLSQRIPGHRITASGDPLPVPHALSDEPLRDHVGNYPSISVDEGVEATFRAFEILKSQGRLVATA